MMAARIWRSSILGLASAQATGSPAGVQIRCSRRPQKNRECEGQYPYPAQPARAERRTAGRERAHSTGVESTTQARSPHRSVSWARARIARASSGSAARSRLLYPDWPGR